MRHALALALVVLLAGCGLIDSISGPGSLSIQRFAASPEDVSAGASVTLAWNVEGADKVLIDNGVGAVAARGTKTVVASKTTTYTLTATAGTSAASASVQVRVTGSVGDPLPFPEPSPTPFPSPSPSPSPSPEPSPTPSPEPEAGCGTPTTIPGGCGFTIEKPTRMSSGQCIELNLVAVDKDCPLAEGSERQVTFRVTAHSDKYKLVWSRAAASTDAVTPESGQLDPNGTTEVSLTDKVVGESGLTIDIWAGDSKTYLRFSLKRD